MPSAAKRRKAAKKKKEKEANINASTNDNRGNDELKFQDEKGSDGDEANSPAYHDHDNHHHPFNEGDEEVEERDPSDVQPSLDVKSMEDVTSDIKSGEIMGGDDDGVVSTEKELKSEESSDSKNVSVGHIDTSNYHPFNEGDEEVEERAHSDARPSLDVKSMEEVTSDIKSGEMIGDDDGVVSTGKELKSDESSDGKNVSVQHIDTANHHPFNEGEEVEEKDPSDAQPSLDVKSMEEVTSDIKSGERVGGDDDGVDSIEQELKSEESSDSKIVSVEHIDTANHHPFNEGDEEVEERDPSEAQPSLDVKSMEEVTGDIKSDEMVVGDDDGVVSIEQELKSEESSDSKIVSVEHVDTANHHPFNEGDEEVEEKDPSEAQPSLDVKSMEEVTGDIKSGEMVVGDDDGVVSIEQELKSEESSDSKNLSVEHIDTANHHPFNEGDEEVEERDPSDAQPSLDIKSMEEVIVDIKSGEMVGGDDGGGFSIEQELKSEEISDNKNVSVKHIDTANHHPFNEGDEEVVERDPSDAQPSLDVKSMEEVTGDIKSGEMVVRDDDGVVKQELKSEESSDSKNVSVEHIDTVSCHPFNEGDEKVEESDPSDAQPSLDVKSMEEVTSDIESGEMVGGDDDGVVSIEQELKSEESFDRKNISAEHIDTANGSYYGNRNSNGTSYKESITEKNLEEPPFNANQKAITSDDLVKLVNSLPSKTTMITENAPAKEIDASVGSSFIVNSVAAVTSVTEVKRNDAESAFIEKSAAPAAAATNLAMKKNDDIVYPLSEENIRTSRLEEHKPKECDSEVPVSLSSSRLIAKDAETQECSANQPLVASAPHMVQKTTWLSCCGLLEVLFGSR